jgi:putative Holliday junction resolvase
MNILGLDFGTKKIGVSLGSSITKSARPLTTFLVEKTLFEKIKSLIVLWRIKLIIIGDPGDFPNNENINQALNNFETTLLKQTIIPIQRWTEQGTSQEAQMLLQSYPGHSRDALAAMLLLTSYLEAHY